MVRKAIIIGSPGSKESYNYLKGVDADLHHLASFLKSPIGGSWDDKEIAVFNKCTTEKLIDTIQNIKCDYILVYFSGHGCHGLNETIIAINDNETMSVSKLISLIQASKGLILIDACRKTMDESYSNFSGQEFLSFNSTYNLPNSSDRFKKIISDCDEGISIAYSCSVGEISNETEIGGIYTYSLLKTTLDWYHMQQNENFLEINRANNLSHQFIKSYSEFEQTPQIINKRNSNQNLNFPFAIK
jgi:hypothetical protein